MPSCLRLPLSLTQLPRDSVQHEQEHAELRERHLAQLVCSEPECGLALHGEHERRFRLCKVHLREDRLRPVAHQSGGEQWVMTRYCNTHHCFHPLADFGGRAIQSCVRASAGW